jgi:hypothetical protein
MAVQVELVALGVAAEIVVIVEDEDAALRLACAIKVSGGEAADARADDDQVVFLAGIGGGGPLFAVAQSMSILKGTCVAAAHSGQQGRVVAEGVLGGGGHGGGGRGGACRSGGVRGHRREQGCRDGGGPQGDAVQEIAPGDGFIHAEMAVARPIWVFFCHLGIPSNG